MQDMTMRLLVCGVVMIASCSNVPNPAVCCSSADDCGSIGVPDESELICALGLVCHSHVCVLPPDAAPPECSQNADCSAAAPICGPNTTCVQCAASDQCSSVSPVCDQVENTCRGCQANDECSSLICTTDTGLCVVETAIVYASPMGSSTAACTQADPCSIQRAIAITDASRNTVRLAPGAYTGSIAVSNKGIILHGEGATLSSTQAPTIAVNDSGHLAIVGLVIANSMAGDDEGVLSCASINNVDVPRLQLQRVTIQGVKNGLTMRKCDAMVQTSILTTTGSGSTITADVGTTATVDRSSILGGGYTVLSTNSSLIRFSNSVIGAPTTGNDALFPLGGGIGISFSTVLNTRVTCAAGAASCSGNAPNGVCLENSIVANLTAGAPADSVTGSACSAIYSLLYPQSAAITGANNKLGMNPLLKDAPNGDVHLLAGSPAINAADPSAASSTDYDGVTRPMGASDMGAFESP